MSRIAAVTRIPSALSSGLNMISIGNSLPSLRRPESSIPVPICCARASAVVRVPSAIRRSANPFGIMVFTCCPRSSSRRYPNSFSARTFRRTISPPGLTTTIASGAASSNPRYLPSICPRCFSAALRTLMSRIAAVTRIPSALSSGLSMISIGNSLPSLRRPVSSIPVPICCARASAVDRVPSAIRRSANPLGMMVFTCCPRSSSRRYPNSFSARTFRRTISPLWFTTTIASGAASRSPRYFAPDSLLSLRSRLITENPRSFWARSRMAVKVVRTRKREPSFRARMPCSSCIPLVAAIRRISAGLPRSISSGVKKREKLRPIASRKVHPVIRSAPGFQLSISPVGPNIRIA